MQTNLLPGYLNFSPWLPLQSPGTIYFFAFVPLFTPSARVMPAKWAKSQTSPFPYVLRISNWITLNPFVDCDDVPYFHLFFFSLSMFLHPYFLVSHLRDKLCLHWGEFYTTLNISQYAFFPRIYILFTSTSCAQKASISNITTILGHSQEGETHYVCNRNSKVHI